MHLCCVGDTNTGTVVEHDSHLFTPSHPVSGTQASGSPTVFVDGKAAARVGDGGTTNCPDCAGPFTNTQGSAFVFIDGQAVVMVGCSVDYHSTGVGAMDENNGFVDIQA